MQQTIARDIMILTSDITKGALQNSSKTNAFHFNSKSKLSRKSNSQWLIDQDQTSDNIYWFTGEKMLRTGQINLDV